MNVTIRNDKIYGLANITLDAEYDEGYRYGDGLYASTTGNVNVGFHDGSTQLFPVTAGQWLKVHYKKVITTNTTATVRGIKGSP